MRSNADGSPQKNLERLRVKYMTDEDIAKLTSSELIDLIKRLLDEVEVRMMELI